MTGNASTVSIGTAALTSSAKAKVVAYAQKYALHRNPAYRGLGDGDCTNFASQALSAGGWSMTGGWWNQNTSWWYGGIPTMTYTWSGADNFYQFGVKNSKRLTAISGVSFLGAGDIVQYDVGPAGMNHTMIVTGVLAAGPLLTYHSIDTLNAPWAVVYNRVMKQNGGVAKFYWLRS